MRWRQWLAAMGVMALAIVGGVVVSPSVAMAEGAPEVTNPTDLLEMADEIGLTQQQRSTLRQLENREEQELGPMRERMHTLGREVQRMMQSDQPDRGAIQERIREVERLSNRLAREERRFQNLVRNAVSARQIRAAQEAMQEHLDEHEDAEEVQ